MGAWIEILEAVRVNAKMTVAPRVGAWIEIIAWVTGNMCIWSLPVWERGLKSKTFEVAINENRRSPCGSVD